MRTLISTLAILLLPAGLQAQQPVDSILLRFNWKAGTTALVEQEWSRIQQSPERSDSVLVHSRYRLNVEEHPLGSVVRTHSFELTPPDGDSTSEGTQLLTGLGSLMPSYVISPEGEILEIADAATFSASVDSLFTPLFQSIQGAPEQVQALLERATSPEVLNASAAESWNLMVGMWVDADWEVGAVYEYAGEEPIPLVPGAMVMMNFEFAAVERTPCVYGGENLDCVLLSMRSAPDSGAFEALLVQLLGMVAPGEEGIVEAIRGAQVLNEIHVVTRPESLEPYWVEILKYVEIPPVPGADTGTVRIDRRTSSYTYITQ